MRKGLAWLLPAGLLFASLSASAQSVAVKTNLLYDGFASPSLGLEFALSRDWTFDISGNTNYLDVNKHEWHHWEVTPEFRYWFCEKFQGNFIGVNLMGGIYNFANIGGLKKFLNNDFTQLADCRVKGFGAGAGFVYGHSWVLGKHWNLEAEIGIGWIYTRYDKYDLKTGVKLRNDAVHNYVGPTKAAINLEYVF